MTRNYLLGFDIGGTKCAVCLGDLSGRPIDRVAFPTGTGFITVWDQLRAGVGELLTRAAVDLNHIKAVGISCGGPLDSKQGIVQSPPNLPGWDDIPITAKVRHELGVPAFLMNDANACALAEWEFGAGQGCENMVFITMGTGFGAGLVLNGRLYEGACGLAGEVGHIRIAPDGHESYGKKGSWEAFCGGNGIAVYAERLGQEPAAQSSARAYLALTGAPDYSVKNLRAAAEKGDPFARRVFSDVGWRLGEGLAILLDLLNPQRVVIGSIFERCESLIRPSLERALAREALPGCAAACRIVPATLGDRIGDFACLLVARHGQRD